MDATLLAKVTERLATLAEGERVTYYIGNLAFEREHNAELNRLADLAMTLAAAGQVKLFQKSFGISERQYIAVGCKRALKAGKR